MRTFTRDELRELAAGYALGALTPEEMAAVESAMSSDAELRREVASYREAAGTILASEPPMVPDAALRERWLRRVRGEGDGRTAAPLAQRAPARGVSRATVYSLGALLAASLVFAVQTAMDLRATRDVLATTQADLEKRDRQLNTVLEAEKGLLVALLKPVATGEAGVQVYWNTRQNRGMLHAFHLPPAPAGRAYQLWVIRDGTPISSRVFNSDADGHALIEQLDLPESADGVSVIAITVEPERGSPQPTSTPIMTGTLSRAAQP